jgi:hypothetical protein
LQTPKADEARSTVAVQQQLQTPQQLMSLQQQVIAEALNSSTSSSNCDGTATDSGINSSSSSSSSSGGGATSSSGRALSAELLSAGQVQQLRRYLEHMLEVNKSMNLTGKGCVSMLYSAMHQ